MSLPALPVTIADVRRAAARLDGVGHRTPVVRSRHLDALTGGRLHLKAEHLQRVGAFKFRGAFNAVAALDEDVRARGVVAYSSGNHAQAVACAAALHGVPATIVMPHDAPRVKTEATRGYGAEVVGYDRDREDRAAIAATIADERGATLVPPYDHPDVIAGQGTVALELLEELPALELLIVPLGGGGLLSGCAVVAAALRPDLTVVGVEPAERAAGRRAMDAGRPVEVDVPATLLDGQRSSSIGALPMALMRALVDRVVGVSDAEVEATVRTLALRTKQVVEPSGASALAAVLHGRLPVQDRTVGVLLSGGNVEPATLARILIDDATSPQRHAP